MLALTSLVFQSFISGRRLKINVNRRFIAILSAISACHCFLGCPRLSLKTFCGNPNSLQTETRPARGLPAQLPFLWGAASERGCKAAVPEPLSVWSRCQGAEGRSAPWLLPSACHGAHAPALPGYLAWGHAGVGWLAFSTTARARGGHAWEEGKGGRAKRPERRKKAALGLQALALLGHLGACPGTCAQSQACCCLESRVEEPKGLSW